MDSAEYDAFRAAQRAQPTTVTPLPYAASAVRVVELGAPPGDPRLLAWAERDLSDNGMFQLLQEFGEEAPFVEGTWSADRTRFEWRLSEKVPLGHAGMYHAGLDYVAWPLVAEGIPMHLPCLPADTAPLTGDDYLLLRRGLVRPLDNLALAPFFRTDWALDAVATWAALDALLVTEPPCIVCHMRDGCYRNQGCGCATFCERCYVMAVRNVEVPAPAADQRCPRCGRLGGGGTRLPLAPRVPVFHLAAGDRLVHVVFNGFPPPALLPAAPAAAAKSQ